MMIAKQESIPSRETTPNAPPTAARAARLIAQRAALESLRDRTTLITGFAFGLGLPILVVLAVIRPVAQSGSSGKDGALGVLMALYLLIVGLLPTSSAVSVAAGQFAGEKERGCLPPLLATPASNFAIFAGKVLGAVIPSLCFALIAEASYLIEISVVLGPAALGTLPLILSLGMFVLVPAYALFGATLSSIISSRVRTYNTAQQIGGLLILPFMFAFFALAFALPTWGTLALVAAVAALIVIDAALMFVGSATWRREEVMAHL